LTINIVNFFAVDFFIALIYLVTKYLSMHINKYFVKISIGLLILFFYEHIARVNNIEIRPTYPLVKMTSYSEVSFYYLEILCGDKGDDGTSFIQGSDVPSSVLGIDGDSYLDDLTDNIYIKVGNVKGEKGEIEDKGDKGDDGTSFIQGSGVPSNALGADDDSYLDNLTDNLYVKVAGIWILSGRIVNINTIIAFR
jgi:hypothetical protein